MLRIRELLGIKEDPEDTNKETCDTNKDGADEAGQAAEGKNDGKDLNTGDGDDETEQPQTTEDAKPLANGQPSGTNPASQEANENKVLVLRYKSDFYLPCAKIPGALLITAATINMLCISFSVHVGKYAIEFYVALLVYACGGILGCLVGFPQKSVERQNGFGITCAIMSSLVAGMAIAQLVYILNIFLVLVAAMCFLASIALIRQVGRVIYTGWRARSRFPGTYNEPRRHMSPVSKIPGIILIVAAVTNLMCIPVFPLCPGVGEIEFGVAFVVYLAVGILGCIAGFNQTRCCVATTKIASKGIAIAMLVMCPLAVGMAIAQIVMRGLAIDKYQNKWGIFYTSIFLEFAAAACFCCCIILMVFASELMACLPPKDFMEPESEHHTVDMNNTGQTNLSNRGCSQAPEDCEEEASGANSPTLEVTKTETQRKPDVPPKDKWWAFWRPHLPDTKSQDASQSKADTKDAQLIEMDTTKSKDIPQNDSIQTTDLIDVTHILKDME